MMKKRLIPIVVLALVVVMSIGIAAIQLGRNSQTIGSYTISGYLEYVTSDGHYFKLKLLPAKNFQLLV